MVSLGNIWKNHKKAIIATGAVVAGAVGYGVYSSLKKHTSNNSNSNSNNSSSGEATSSDDGGTGSSSGTGTASKSKKSTPTPIKHEQAVIQKPLEIHVKPKTYSLQRLGLEVYKTNEEEYKQYISPYNQKAVDTTTTEESTDDDMASEEDVKNKFKLHKGQIEETYYYVDLLSMNCESDYNNMSQSLTFNRGEVNLSQFYKGVRVCVLSEWEEPLKTLQWDDLKVLNEGFITEQTFKEKNVDVKIDGFTKLLEQKIPFKFQEMYRSEILREIILSAGLQPFINSDGLDDDITQFTNEVKTNSSSNKPIGESSGNIAQLAQEVCKGKTSDRDKAQAIHTYIRNHVDYPEPNYSNHRKCPTQVLASGLSNCCDRARLGHEMANAVGLENRGVHGPGHVWIQYKINGKWVDSDPGVSRPKLGSVWQGMSMDSTWEFPSCT